MEEVGNRVIFPTLHCPSTTHNSGELVSRRADLLSGVPHRCETSEASVYSNK